MKFVSVRDLRGRSAEIWRELPGEREMVITSNGRPVAILATVSESNLEESLAAFRQARVVEAVSSMQRRASATGAEAITAADIEAEISAARAARKG